MFTLPIINVKANPLDALLYGLGLRLEYLSKNNDNQAYHELIKDKEVAIQFISEDMARYYRFVDGHFGQALGNAKYADLTINFKDPMTGVKLLTSGDVADFMTAIQEGEVAITGDYKLVMWFVGVGKHAAKVPEKYQPYIEQAKPYLQMAKPYANKAYGLAQKVLGNLKK